MGIPIQNLQGMHGMPQSVQGLHGMIPMGVNKTPYYYPNDYIRVQMMPPQMPTVPQNIT